MARELKGPALPGGIAPTDRALVFRPGVGGAQSTLGITPAIDGDAVRATLATLEEDIAVVAAGLDGDVLTKAALEGLLGATAPTAATTVPALSAMYVLLADNTYITGTQLLTALGVTGTPSPTPTPTPTPNPTPSPTPTPTAGPTLALTSPTFSTAPSGWGKALSGGSGTASLAVPLVGRTVECRFRASALDGSYHRLITTQNLEIAITSTGRFLGGGGGSAAEYSNANICDGAWHHLAVTVNQAGNVGHMHIDGAYVQYIDAATLGTAAGTAITIAAAGGTNGDLSGFGELDEVRVSNIARYGATAFTPPNGPFTADANTLGLWHFDADSGVAS